MVVKNLIIPQNLSTSQHINGVVFICMSMHELFSFTGTECPRKGYLRYGQVKYQFITAVIMKFTVFWDLKPCTSVYVYQRLGETCCL
jgi:hypothetical protein